MSKFTKPADWKPASNIVLDDAAAEVVTSSKSCSVIAGPGAGKTELLAQRAAYLLQTGVCRPPQRVLAISFKRDAAKNLSDRVIKRCGSDMARRFESYTFDAFCKSLLDRFLSASPTWCRPPRNYHILFPTRDDWNDFVNSKRVPDELGGRNAGQLASLEKTQAWGPLPLAFEDPSNARAWLAREWWKRLLGGRRPGLSFPMIARLAEAILRHNPNIAAGLRLTYSHVFLDEFQDTTRMQFDLLKLGFEGSQSILTAVGDTKQRIMTWAGAEAEVFSWFEDTFRAERKRLQLNFRSNRAIVSTLNKLVKIIEPNAVSTISARAEEIPPEQVTGFFVFADNLGEAKWLASFIAAEIHNKKVRSPSDFAILVRVRASRIYNQLRDAFSNANILLRDETKLLNGIAIQDLQVDDICLLIIRLMRLALGVRGREIYNPVQEAIIAIYGFDRDNESDIKKLDGALRSLLTVIKQTTDSPPADVDMLASVANIVETIGTEKILRAYRQYENEEYFHSILVGIAALMSESLSDDWTTLLDKVEGKDAVKLLTVHKSKGLEYHTVFVVGVHENSFFGYQRNREEETNAFFVALSRARERVFFTRSKEGGETRQIEGLIDLLKSADVPFHEIA